MKLRGRWQLVLGSLTSNCGFHPIRLLPPTEPPRVSLMMLPQSHLNLELVLRILQNFLHVL